MHEAACKCTVHKRDARAVICLLMLQQLTCSVLRHKGKNAATCVTARSATHREAQNAVVMGVVTLVDAMEGIMVGYGPCSSDNRRNFRTLEVLGQRLSFSSLPPDRDAGGHVSSIRAWLLTR